MRERNLNLMVEAERQTGRLKRDSHGRRPATAPSSTYRLQFNAAFTLKDAAELLDYLSALGVGAIYASPLLRARSGSLHGYDVVDHSAINPELADEAAIARFWNEMQRVGMGLVLDVVPNHMCIADALNSRWQDVLENGPGSPQARFFDIDWLPPREGLTNKVLLPILGDQFGVVLEKKEIRIEYAEGGFVVCYWERRFPAAPRSWLMILELMLADLRGRAEETAPAIMELESIATAIRYLPLRTETDTNRIRERQREKSVIRTRLAALLHSSRDCVEAVRSALETLNGTLGDASSFTLLERFLDDQAYRLSYWRVASDEINYRRFFDVNELAAIRVEDPDVFTAVHERALEWIRTGWVTGLRIDHPDGLSDPVQYFHRLQHACRDAVNAGEEHQSDGRFYVIAEKILVGAERPRSTWDVDGTTGYGFLNELNGLFVDTGAHSSITRAYEEFTGNEASFTDLIYESKRLILRVSMSSELNVLARRLDRICQRDRHTRDFTLESLRFALKEIIACFPVYRTYIREHESHVDPEDGTHICFAVDEASRRNPAISASVFEVIRSILLLEDPPYLTPEQTAERRLFIMRFQQLTGPVMAKGVEDTAFYRRYPLASLNEVGGDPGEFGIAPEEFHKRIMNRQRLWPHNMLTTSTHDTKRGEDVRARINVLSEVVVDWEAAVNRWSALNARLRVRIEGQEAPDRNAEYLLYQTLVGAWPLLPLSSDDERAHFVQRIRDYMQKALREAKVRTSWINPEEEYDAAIARFTEQVLKPGPENEFLRDFLAFLGEITFPGLLNSISQVVMKLTCPGMPDIYQGNEMWDFSLVDPDNRRPVDYVERRRLLESLPEQATPAVLKEMLSHPEDGRLKLFVTQRLLRLRRDEQEFFLGAGYVPLTTFGDQKEHAIAFVRTSSKQIVVVAVGRFFARLRCSHRLPVGDDVWHDSAIVLPNDRPDLHFTELFSGRSVRAAMYRNRSLLSLSDVFADFPVAVLVAKDN